MAWFFGSNFLNECHPVLPYLLTPFRILIHDILSRCEGSRFLPFHCGDQLHGCKLSVNCPLYHTAQKLRSVQLTRSGSARGLQVSCRRPLGLEGFSSLHHELREGVGTLLHALPRCEVHSAARTGTDQARATHVHLRARIVSGREICALSVRLLDCGCHFRHGCHHFDAKYMGQLALVDDIDVLIVIEPRATKQRFS